MKDQDMLLGALKRYWGYDSFRPMQRQVVESVMAGADTLALMPTGAGKSLLYQLPALLMEGVCIVVTPLVALMKDQVDSLRNKGIPAAYIHSGLTQRQIDLTLDNASWGDLKFLYVSPERLETPVFRQRAPKMNVCLLAVDEAHCISQWGYDFRPSYLNISRLRPLLPDTPALALTASATPEVARDIMKQLGMAEGRLLRSGFARPNLSLAVRHTDDKKEQLLRIASNVGGSGIVYTRTREEAEKLAEWLAVQGLGAQAYHAGMPHAERTARQERWSRGETAIMVSTNAFGMGIDKADVRFVAHYDVCDSVEAYYQEAGRAGRDGHRAYAVLLAASDEGARALKRFEGEFPSLENIKNCYEKLFNYLQIGIGDGKHASFEFNLHSFASYAKMYTGVIRNAIKILQQNGYMTLTDDSDNPPRIMFEVGRDELYRVRIEREELDHILRTIMRLYAGVFSGKLIPIDERQIAQSAGYTPEHVHELLRKLWRLRIIRYVPGSRSPVLMLHEERLPVQDVFISPESYKIRKEMAAQRLEAMHAYVANAEKCRSAVLREYFGDEGAGECGVCDICLARRKADEGREAGADGAAAELAREIVDKLRQGPLSVKELVALFRTDPENVIRAIANMLENRTATAGDDGKITLLR